MRCLATHRTAQSALSSAFVINVFKTTRIAAGVSFNGVEFGKEKGKDTIMSKNGGTSVMSSVRDMVRNQARLRLEHAYSLLS
jgi:hypothetical protein